MAQKKAPSSRLTAVDESLKYAFQSERDEEMPERLQDLLEQMRRQERQSPPDVN
ncbi:MAG: hypothetical protein AAGF74_00125 [Pseudomonadota bacterium]